MSNEGVSLGLAGDGPRDVDDSFLLIDIARAAVDRASGEVWRVEPAEFWCRVTPVASHALGQGWKLHVSATVLSASVVLARVADVLLREKCPFKFARGLTELGELTSRNVARGSGGKFITAYPADDDQFRLLAAELDRVTDGLPGPPILSDRPIRPGSLVYYRYGVFGAPMELTNDGSFESVLIGPDGQRSRDQRLAWFSPPSWAKSPFDHEIEAVRTAADPPPAPKSPTSVLIGDRFLVRGAIKHSYRGGVFRAVDQQTGTDVILKQARPYVMTDLTGTDGRDVLRHEADVLELLGPLGISPAKVAVVEHEANLFLAEEMLPGTTLREWARGHSVTSWRGEGAPATEAVALARQMVDIVASVHERGMVLRDLTPTNMIVTPDNRLQLIDLELALLAGERAVRSYTRAYVGPEVVSSLKYGPAPTFESDLFSLGATIFFMACGLDPLLPYDDDSTDRSNQSRLRALVERVARDMPAVRLLSPMIIGLLHDDPQTRWSTADARAFLDGKRGAVAENVSEVRLTDSTADRIIVDGLTQVLRTMRVEEPRLFKASGFGRTTDPCSVQHGAAGVLGVLTRAAHTLGDRNLLDGVSTVATWISGRLFDIPQILPGLYFGRSGVAWALYDAARLLGDDEMAARAIELAKRVPVQWPNPDICHGAAGAGMAQWHFWTATGDPEFKQRGIQAADCVLQAAQERDGKWLWPIPNDFDSDLAGLAHYGFAHGVAGSGAFLLYAWLATGRDEYLTGARRAGDTLQAVADVEDGLAWWPSGEEKQPGKSRMRHWCSGSSGVGTFLVRLWKATNEQRFRDLAEAAAAAIRRDKWYSGPSACHGLAGDGEFLLDLADFTGAQRYRHWAQELAELLYVRNTIRDGLMVLPDESGAEVYPGFNTAMGGSVGFLLRLRTGGPRWWMPDELLADNVPVGVAGQP